MTWILGISAFYHDSSVALLRDGEIVFAASEEIYSRRKHDGGFPTQALAGALGFANISPTDVDFVGFYEKPLLKLERLLESYLAFAPRGYRSFAAAIPSWLQTKLHTRREIRRRLGSGFTKRIIFCEHHESHAASAFYLSPFDDAAILTVDGVGEWATASLGIGTGSKIQLHSELLFPHSLGLLYSAFTYFCGFRVNSGEYKLMGLAPYGEPRYYDLLLGELLCLRPDGSFRLNMKYFGYCHTLHMTTAHLEDLLGARRRKSNEPLRQFDRDVAASVQKLTEEVLLRMARHLHARTGISNLVLAGGVALNCVANARILNESPFQKIWIQPASGDAGGALGVASLIWYQLLGNARIPQFGDSSVGDFQSGSMLGPRVDEDSEVEHLMALGAVVHRCGSSEEIIRRVAKLLADGKIVGWVQGRQEFGPRALGNRSILADPRDRSMREKLNRKIKNREMFRPFAPAVLEEYLPEYFEVELPDANPYMLTTVKIRPEFRTPVDRADMDSMERLATSTLPAVTHVDHSARVQSVGRERTPLFHALLEEFRQQTGCPALVNTSFNVRGEPLVRTASEAYRCFSASGMDAMAIGNYLFLADQQPTDLRESSRQYLEQLEVD